MSTPKSKPSRRAAKSVAVAPAPVQPIIVIVTNNDDWEGLYVNGQLVAEEHTLRRQDLLNALGVHVSEYSLSGDYLGGEVSRLPEAYTDIPAAAFVD